MDGLHGAAEPGPFLATDAVSRFAERLRELSPLRFWGRVEEVVGTRVRVAGLDRLAAPGDLCCVHAGRSEAALLGEVVAVGPAGAVLATYGEAAGVPLGARVRHLGEGGLVFPHESWRGRVLDGFARPIDDRGLIARGSVGYPLRASAPPAGRRRPLGPRLATGVRAIDLFTPCCAGQRLGIFAGSGVGKSSLLAMVAKAAAADVVVIGLVGERGREVDLFLREVLGPEGLSRSVVVVATSDSPAMLRCRAGRLTLAVAEYFRDRGAQVLCLFDSVTRFAMALREVHLAAGELPAARGYPPSVFTELPKLLERAGPGTGEGSITALFSVLVEGDDFNEPVSDTVRGVLDGHILLDRGIAERGRFPAVDVLRSLSRSAPGCYSGEERALVERARRLLATYAEMAELVEIGAYRPGTNPALDEAIRLRPALEALLAQDVAEPATAEDPFARLRAVLEAEGAAG